MRNHVGLKIGNLSAEVLESIHASHLLLKCPKCGDQLHNKCSSDVSLMSEETYKACHKCKIVWKLEETRWTEETGSGMVTDYGYHTHLVAFSDCIHRCKLIHLMDYGNGFGK